MTHPPPPDPGPPTPGRPIYPGYTPYVGPGAPPTNPLAAVALALGIIGIPSAFCFGVGGLLGLVGAILGQQARREIAAKGELGDGMAVTGIVLGLVALVCAVAAVAFNFSAIYLLRNR
jgi:hypothetical protein